MSHKVSSCEVIVVGGGVIGAACARAAALRGLRVALCEPGPDRAAASRASAGLLAAQIEPPDEWLRGLAVRGRDLYEGLAGALRETTGLDIGFWRAGIASVAFDDAAADRLRDVVAQQRQAGLRCDWLEPDDVVERFLGAAPACRGALFAPEDGAVDPAALTGALLADARRLGVTMLSERVGRVVPPNRGTAPAAADRARPRPDGRRPLAQRYAPGHPLLRPQLRAGTRWRSADGKHHGACGVRRPGDGGGDRRNRERRRAPPARARDGAAGAHLGGSAARDSRRSADRRRRPGNARALVRHRARPQRHPARGPNGRRDRRSAHRGRDRRRHHRPPAGPADARYLTADVPYLRLLQRSVRRRRRPLRAWRRTAPRVR